MTPAEQNRALAEIEGLSLEPIQTYAFLYASASLHSRGWMTREEAERERQGLIAAGFEVTSVYPDQLVEAEVPGYVNDLNALARIEAKLDGSDGGQFDQYTLMLAKQYKRAFRATAPERAECLLRLYGKWKD